MWKDPEMVEYLFNDADAKAKRADARTPKVRTSHHRNAEEAARLQKLVDEKFAPSADGSGNFMRDLAEELREYTAMKYAGDCKCGKCQLVPRDLIERIYHTLGGPALLAENENALLRKAAQDFIDKVDRGEARSRDSYAAFKAALNGADGDAA